MYVYMYYVHTCTIFVSTEISENGGIHINTMYSYPVAT